MICVAFLGGWVRGRGILNGVYSGPFSAVNSTGHRKRKRALNG